MCIIPTTHGSYQALVDDAEYERTMKNSEPDNIINVLAGSNDSDDLYGPYHMHQQGVEIFNAPLLEAVEQ